MMCLYHHIDILPTYHIIFQCYYCTSLSTLSRCFHMSRYCTSLSTWSRRFHMSHYCTSLSTWSRRSHMSYYVYFSNKTVVHTLQDMNYSNAESKLIRIFPIYKEIIIVFRKFTHTEGLNIIIVSILLNLRKYYPSLPVNIIKRIYRAQLERLRVLMINDIPEHIRWLIEAQVLLSGEFSNPFKYMPGTGRSNFAKKRRAKKLGVCYKCAWWTCDTRCKSLGFVSKNREDKIAFIKDGLSKESMDHDIQQILDTHRSGYVHRELLALWSQFKDERERYSHEKLVSKDPICKSVLSKLV
ncbi:hypothetical protein OROMI_018269 [Orobanche minor]